MTKTEILKERLKELINLYKIIKIFRFLFSTSRFNGACG